MSHPHADSSTTRFAAPFSLPGEARSAGVAYQSVAVAGARILHRVLERERQATAATISLAQREKLRAMVGGLDDALGVICRSLSAPCNTMLDDLADAAVADDLGETNWWFALTEVISEIDSGIEVLLALVATQPKGGPSRGLAGLLVRLLHRHRTDLLHEAEQWIS